MLHIGIQRYNVKILYIERKEQDNIFLMKLILQTICIICVSEIILCNNSLFKMVLFDNQFKSTYKTTD
jgi:hypothetical protein